VVNFALFRRYRPVIYTRRAVDQLSPCRTVQASVPAYFSQPDRNPTRYSRQILRRFLPIV